MIIALIVLVGALLILGPMHPVGAAQRTTTAGGGFGQPPPAEAAAPVNISVALPGVFVVGHELFVKASLALSEVLFDGRPIAVREISPSELLSTPNRSVILIDVGRLPVNSSLQILGALIKRGDLVALYGGNYSEGYLAYALGITWASAYGEKFLAVPVAAIGSKLVGAYGDGYGIIYAPTSIEDLPTTLEKYAEWLTAKSAGAGLALSPTTESLQSTSTGGDPCYALKAQSSQGIQGIYSRIAAMPAYSDGNGTFGYDMCIYMYTGGNSGYSNPPTVPITIGGYVYYAPSSTMVNNLGQIVYLNGTLDGATSYEYMQYGVTNSVVNVMGTSLSPAATSNQPQYSVSFNLGSQPSVTLTVTIPPPSTVTIRTYDYPIAGYDNYTWQYTFSSTQAGQLYIGSFADSYAGWDLYGGLNSPNTATLPEDVAVELIMSVQLPRSCYFTTTANYELIWVVNYWLLYYNPPGNWSAQPSIPQLLFSNQPFSSVSPWSEKIPIICWP